VSAPAHIQELCDWLEQHGAVVTSLSYGGKHGRIYFDHQGRSQFYVVGMTPSDWRAQLNAKSDLRHMLGLVEPVKRVGKRREKIRRGRNGGEPIPPVPTITGGPDWQAPLSKHPGYMRYLKAREHELWLQFWRGCMAAVGARSLL